MTPEEASSSQEVRRGFMCATDFQFHLGGDTAPTKVYPDEEALRAERPCVAECGIVEVEVSVVRWVQRSDYSSLVVGSGTSLPQQEG